MKGNDYSVSADVFANYAVIIRFVVAVYDDGKMLDVQCNEQYIPVGGKTIRFDYLPSITLEDHYRIKIMAWDKETMVPYCPAEEKRIVELSH